MRAGKAIALVIVAAIIVAACFDVYTVTAYTCLECRAVLSQRRICGIPIDHVSQNDYSASILAHDPGHQHRWCGSGSRHRYSLLTVGMECGHRHPIWSLQVPVQAEYAKLVPDAEFHAALRAIDSPDPKRAETTVLQIQERVLNAGNPSRSARR